MGDTNFRQMVLLTTPFQGYTSTITNERKRRERSRDATSLKNKKAERNMLGLFILHNNAHVKTKAQSGNWQEEYNGDTFEQVIAID